MCPAPLYGQPGLGASQEGSACIDRIGIRFLSRTGDTEPGSVQPVVPEVPGSPVATGTAGCVDVGEGRSPAQEPQEERQWKHQYSQHDSVRKGASGCDSEELTGESANKPETGSRPTKEAANGPQGALEDGAPTRT